VARLDALTNWERRLRRSMRPTLAPMRDLLERLDLAEQGFRAVHVAGSKGKGSLTALVAAGLERAGWATGAYLSPHVERIQERVRLGGREVEDGRLAEGLEAALAARDAAAAQGTAGRDATWFDTLTAAALWTFARAEVQWGVVECGLGGRLDSTNVLRAEVCAITSIELEHTSVLGATRARIAAEKAGILKPGSSLVTPLPAEDEAGAVIAARARELGVRVLRPAPGPVPFEALSFSARSRALAELVLAELGARGHETRGGEPLGPALLDAEALRAARLPGRMEPFSARGVRVVLDGAHTPESVAGALRELGADETLRGRPTVILGMALEKNLEGILKALAGRTDRVVCTSVGSALHRTPEQIASAAGALGMAVETAAEPRMALEQALISARAAGGWVLAIGSLYLAGALRPLLAEADRTPC
jgi:dihydrofolate synthase/folylpolyglutamate synthase